jgi:predicted N-formylglutamate amidohydrolase
MSVLRSLLAPDEPAPVVLDRRDGASPFVILCDHAGNSLPRALGSLGLAERELRRHIAWDIGAGAVAARLGGLLDAAVLRQHYSRLAIDCNRAPDHPDSIVVRSEATTIPGNIGLGVAEKEARRRAIFAPYHDAIDALLDERCNEGRETIVIAQHSFTAVFHGLARPWQAGVLYDRDARLARAVGDLLRAEGFVVGDNEPYRLSPTSDYTIPIHAERRGLPYVEIELRQDLIADGDGQAAWAARLARLLPMAATSLYRKSP